MQKVIPASKHHKGDLVTADEIKLAHTLSQAGLSNRKVSELLKRSYATTTRIIEADDLKDYRAKANELYKARLLENIDKKAASDDSLEGSDRKPPTNYSADEWQKSVTSQLNSIIAVLKAIEYKLPKQSERGE